MSLVKFMGKIFKVHAHSERFGRESTFCLVRARIHDNSKILLNQFKCCNQILYHAVLQIA